ncbi:rhodanese-like domain-containing protein [Winogradskyella sp.]|uniref:rhodanese-like domain-containing protein n=1 Tax=Winogradskyella sp. TaxID=1883156 RepID=UPI003F6CD300
MAAQQVLEVVVKDQSHNHMIKSTIHIIVFVIGFVGFPQDSLSEVLEKHNSESIPYISVEELDKVYSETIILDAREITEYNISHLKNATHVGYDDFDISVIKTKLKSSELKIVVYCSIGVRSEDIAEELKAAGFTNIFNLFGGIFEWKNNGFTVYDNENKPTDNVHAYSKNWGKWLLKGTKVYD